MKELNEKLHEVRNMAGDLGTVCCRQCGCCRTGCPQMKYSEAMSIIQHIWENWSKEDKKQFFITCVKHFFSRSLIKPCPILRGNECRVYQNRPLGCRLYGQWPDDMYQERVAMISSKLNLPPEQVPLNVQCPFVKPKSGQKPTKEQIEAMYAALDELDVKLLSGGKLKKEKEWRIKVGKNWNYRTIHDWTLYHIWGEDRLVQYTQVAIIATDEQLSALMETFEKVADQLVEMGALNVR